MTKIAWDESAEQAVLGAMLVSPNTIPVVGDILTAEDFYRKRDQEIFVTILSLWVEDETSADAVTVARRHPEHRDYIFALSESCITSANVDHYAELVRADSVSRNLRRVGLEIVEISDKMVPDGPVKMLNEAESRLSSVQMHNTSYRHHSAEVAYRIIDAIERGEKPKMVSTGFSSIDKYAKGFYGSNFVILGARPGVGKAQPLSARVLTPSGFVAMGDISAGDTVITGDGSHSKVLGVYPQGMKDVFRVVCRDGETRATADHLWFTSSRLERRRGSAGSVKTTAEIAATICRPDGYGFNHHLPDPPQIDWGKNTTLPLDPYLLGVWLGDGCRSRSVIIDNSEQDIVSRIKELLPADDTITVSGSTVRIKRAIYNGKPSKTFAILEELGLHDKHSYERFIPEQYVFASATDRLRLVQGMCDSDGSVASAGAIEWLTTSEILASDMAFVCRSLGASIHTQIKKTHYTKNGNRTPCRDAYRLHIRFPAGVAPVSSKKHLSVYNGTNRLDRAIIDVVSDGREECQCILIDHPDHTYITDDFITTHNTCLGLAVAQRIALEGHVLFFSLEMRAEELGERLLASIAGVSLTRIREHSTTEQETESLKRAQAVLDDSHLSIVDDPSLTMFSLASRVRSETRRQEVKLIVVDYLQLMTLGAKSEGRREEVSEMSRRLKALAMETNVPILALSQLNRVSTFDNNKIDISQLRESGSLEQDADMVWLLDWPKKNNDTWNVRVVELTIAKNRHGPMGKVDLYWQPAYQRYEE